MTVLVKHATLTNAAADSTALVDGPAWDAAHTVTGLENVDNTSDANKPISSATQTALNLKANIDSPTLTGTPAAPTAAVDTNTTQIATQAAILQQAASATPLGAAATAVVGTSTRFARADHVHPGREVLTANRTYYVRTDGSNSNTGLVNTAGGAFLTVQKAIDVVSALDISIYNVTIQVGNGTYTGALTVTGPWIGSGTVSLTGDTTTPSNVVMSITGTFLTMSANARLTLGGFRVSASSIAYNLTSGATLFVTGKMEYVCAGFALMLIANCYFRNSADYTLSGNISYIVDMYAPGYFDNGTCTVTLSGTPAYTAFVIGSRNGAIYFGGTTFSGSATGKRYDLSFNAIVDVAGGGATFLPGNAAGTTATGGQYA